MTDKPIYLSGLNGLRAIAAMSVVIAHTSVKDVANFGLPLHLNIPMAGFGVTLFFVISGFLITFLLLQEKKKHDDIDIKKFYVRRILRIWPIYYLFIFICICVFLFIDKSHEIIQKELWFYVFFAANVPFIFQQGILILVHYWSIGVEEQFYLFWPWIVRFSKDKLLKIAVLIFSGLFFIKLICWWLMGNDSLAYRFLTVTRFHCMMIGAVGAILYFKKHTLFLKMFSNKIVQLIAWSVFFILGLGIFHIPAVVVQELIAICSLSMIIGQVSIESRIINLENKVCDFIGKISYGIYVIHPLIILLLSRLYKNIEITQSLKYILVYVSVIILTLLVAWLSYSYFEQPFLKLKNKFAVVKSSNSMLTKIV